MKENRNDRHYGQTSSTQQPTRSGQSTEESMDSERSLLGTQIGSEPFDQDDLENLKGPQLNPRSQRSGEYSSSDEMDDLEEDEPISMVEEEDEEDFLDDDEMDQRGRQGSDFGSGSQNR